MTRVEIRARYLAYRDIVKDYRNKIDTLQLICKHPRALKVPKASTGNYDPSEDRYWYDCSCADCGKFWTEDQ